MKVYYWNTIGRWILTDLAQADMKKTEKDFYTTWAIYAEEELENGRMWGNFVMDFDSDNLEHSKQDTIFIYKKLVEKGVKPENIIVLFSGAKGFHLEVDYRSFLKSALYDLPAIYRYLALGLIKGIPYDTVDKRIYSAKRMWRYPNTINSKTGMYCTYLTFDQLLLSMDEIKEIAKSPQERNSDFTEDQQFRNMVLQSAQKVFEDIKHFNNKISLMVLGDNSSLPCIDSLLSNGPDESSRNNSLYILACYFKRKTTPIEKAKETLIPWGVRYGLSDKEAQITIESAYRSDRDGIGCSNEILRSRCDRSKCSVKEELKDYENEKYLEDNFITFDFKGAKQLVDQRKTDGFYNRVIKTGFVFLDKYTKISKDTFLVIGANTSVGKSTLLASIANNLQSQNKRVLYLSLEETIDRATNRLLKMGYQNNDNFIIAKPKQGLMKVEDVEKYAKKYDPDVFLIDQMTWLDSGYPAERERIKYREIAKRLYSMTQSISPRPIILLHQLNRKALSRGENGAPLLPTKENLAEGADIERIATDVWIMSWVKLSDGNRITCINIDKNRWGISGKTGLVKFNEVNIKFEDFSYQEIKEIREKYTDELKAYSVEMDDCFIESENVKKVRDFFQ